jgi:hypothetical protein
VKSQPRSVDGRSWYATNPHERAAKQAAIPAAQPLFPSGLSQQEILHCKVAFASGQWRSTRAARYLTVSGRQSGFDFYQLIERFAARPAPRSSGLTASASAGIVPRLPTSIVHPTKSKPVFVAILTLRAGGRMVKACG